MASVKMLADFDKKVIKALKELGATYVEESYRHVLTLETKAGLLTVSLHKEEKPSNLFSIFGRFEDVEKAKLVLSASNQENLNKYSGKWNYHYLGAKTCLEVFLWSLKDIEA